MTTGPIVLRRRPLVVEAWQVEAGNVAEVAAWAGGMAGDGKVLLVTDTDDFAHADVGDWVLRGPFGEFYPAPDNVVFASYEGVVSVVSE